jgi:hypothetical protein
MREAAVTYNTTITQLKSADPKQRFEAVKQAARAKDETALRTLAVMAHSDPDPQVRAAAERAEQYIRRALDEVEHAPHESVRSAVLMDDPAAKPKRKQREISEADINRARGYVEVALTHQTNNERTKALKAMSRALELNPNAAHDNYFRSVLDEITGLSGDESLALLADSSEQRKIAATEAQLKKERKVKGHMGDVQKTTWASAGMDLAIYTMILIFSGLILVVAFTQTAASIRPGWNDAQSSYNEALARGETPKDLERPDAALQMADEIGSMNIGLSHAIVFGLIMGVSGLIGILTQLIATHIVARFLFQGQGTLPFLVYRVVSFYNSRLPIVMFLLILAIVSLVSSGGGAIYLVLMVVIGLFSLYMTFAVLGRIGQAYDFGMARGCLSWVIGSIALSVISTLPVSLALGTIMGQVLAIFTRSASL